MRIPSFILRKLYVPGSLQREAGGVRFRLRNTLATATLTELRRLTIDGHAIAPERVRAVLDGQAVDSTQVSAASPLVFPRSAEAEIHVAGLQLGPRASVRLEAQSQEFGELVIEFEDAAA